MKYTTNNPTADAAIEKLAQRYAARGDSAETSRQQSVVTEDKTGTIAYQSVDVDSLEMAHPRSVGVENEGLSALS